MSSPTSDPIPQAPSLLNELKLRTLVADGAMGTQLLIQGLRSGESGELWNLQQPHIIQAIHTAYLNAGCDLITTNTFGANVPTLQNHHLADQAHAINLAAAQIAKKAVHNFLTAPSPSLNPLSQDLRRHRWVLGDIGPFGGFLQPLGEMEPQQLLAIFHDQCQALLEGGADGIIIETMVDPAEIEIAIQAAKKANPHWPVIATYTFNKPQSDSQTDTPEFRTIMGTTVDKAMQYAIDAGADIVGANCGTSLSLDDYWHLAQQIVDAAGVTPTILQPNAGSPVLINDLLVHPASPQEMAKLVADLHDVGIKIIGGCCGTSPAHLTAIAQTLHQQ